MQETDYRLTPAQCLFSAGVSEIITPRFEEIFYLSAGLNKYIVRASVILPHCTNYARKLVSMF